MACAAEQYSYSDLLDRLEELQDYRSFLISQRDDHIEHSGIIQEQLNEAQSSGAQHDSSLQEHLEQSNKR